MATYGHTFTSGDTVTPTKLNDARTVSDIVNADISASAAIAGTKLADDSITNAKIKSDAAIAGTKVAPDFGSQDVVTTGGAFLGHTQSIFSGKLEVFDAGAGAFVSIMRHSNDSAGPGLVLVKTRGTTADSKTVVQSNDALGTISWQGTDGSTNKFAASISAAVDGTPGTNDMPGRLVFSTTADGGSTAVERMRITNDGAALVGKTLDNTTDEGCVLGASGYGYFVRSNNTCVVANRTSGNGIAVSLRRDNVAVGNISVTTTATAYNTSSDYRLKENATPLTGGLALIEQVRPMEFDWKGLNEKGRGFIAHELQAVVPEAVTGEKDAVDAEGNPQYQGVDASKIVPLLVAAVQELSAKVAALEAAR